MAAPDDVPPVSFWRMFLRKGGWIFAIVLIFGIALNLISLRQHWQANRLDASGITVMAQITDRERVETTGSDGETKVTYYLTFRFEQDGVVIEERKSVGRSQYVGSPIGIGSEVRFLPSNPSGFEVYVGATRDAARGFQVGALFLAGIGLVLSYLRGLNVVKALRARRSGQVEEAEVLEVRYSGFRINKARQYRLHWKTDSGAQGKSWLRPLGGFDGFDPGDRIVVFTFKDTAVWRGDVGSRPERHSKVPKVERD